MIVPLGLFKDYYETLAYIMVREDSQEHFLDYSYSKQNSKILHCYYKKRIPSSFPGTFFNRHRIRFESGAFQTTFSNLYYFLPSTTHRVKDRNRHRGSINLLPIDIPEKTFEVEEMLNLTLQSLITIAQKRKKLLRLWVKMLKKIIEISNSNLIKNTGRLLSKRNVGEEVEWIGDGKKRLPEGRYKMSY